MNERVVQETLPDDVVIPDGKTLGDWVESRVARLSTRTFDWNALKFQADFDPKYKRAQMRYVGTGEKMTDLALFDSTTFVDALFARQH